MSGQQGLPDCAKLRQCGCLLKLLPVENIGVSGNFVGAHFGLLFSCCWRFFVEKKSGNDACTWSFDRKCRWPSALFIRSFGERAGAKLEAVASRGASVSAQAVGSDFGTEARCHLTRVVVAGSRGRIISVTRWSRLLRHKTSLPLASVVPLTVHTVLQKNICIRFVSIKIRAETPKTIKQ